MSVPTKLIWPHPESSSVHVTGDWDQWSTRHPLEWDSSAFRWSTSIDLPANTRVHFKFVINGDQWKTRDDQPTEADSAGNVNNYLITDKAKPATTAPPATSATETSTKSTEKSADKKVGSAPKVEKSTDKKVESAPKVETSSAVAKPTEQKQEQRQEAPSVAVKTDTAPDMAITGGIAAGAAGASAAIGAVLGSVSLQDVAAIGGIAAGATAAVGAVSKIASGRVSSEKPAAAVEQTPGEDAEAEEGSSSKNGSLVQKPALQQKKSTPKIPVVVSGGKNSTRSPPSSRPPSIISRSPPTSKPPSIINYNGNSGGALSSSPDGKSHTLSFASATVDPTTATSATAKDAVPTVTAKPEKVMTAGSPAVPGKEQPKDSTKSTISFVPPGDAKASANGASKAQTVGPASGAAVAAAAKEADGESSTASSSVRSSKRMSRFGSLKSKAGLGGPGSTFTSSSADDSFSSVKTAGSGAGGDDEVVANGGHHLSSAAATPPRSRKPSLFRKIKDAVSPKTTPEKPKNGTAAASPSPLKK